MSKLIVKELEYIFNSVEPMLRETEERVKAENNETSKEFDKFMNEMLENGKRRYDVIADLRNKKRYLEAQRKERFDDINKEIAIRQELIKVDTAIAQFEKVRSEEFYGADVADAERIKNEERKKVIAQKLQETYDAIEAESEKSNVRLREIHEKLLTEPSLVREFNKELKKNEKLKSHLAVAARLQNYDKRFPDIKEEAKLLEGLEPNSDEYALFSELIKYINEYGNISKDVKEPIHKQNRETDYDPTKKDEPEPVPPTKDDTEEPEPIIDDVEIEEPIQIPQNISQKPEKTWKTVAAVALGAGVAIGSYLAFGPAGTGVVMAVSGVGKLIIRNKEKKLQEQEQIVIRIGEHIAEINANSNQLKEQLSEDIRALASAETDEQKQEITDRINQTKDAIAANNQAVSDYKAQAQDILNRIYPDLKAAEFNGPEKITNINDAKEKVKAKARKFKAYLGSKEGLRDARWFMNSALLTSAGINIAHTVAGMINTPAPIDTAVATPASPAETTSVYDGIGVGESVNGYNVSVGHDTASWALEGTNTENLISEYVNGADSIFKGFRIQTPTGTVPLDLQGMNLSEFLQANPNIDPSSIVADVARKDGISQAWISIDELIKGVGGMSK